MWTYPFLVGMSMSQDVTLPVPSRAGNRRAVQQLGLPHASPRFTWNASSCSLPFRPTLTAIPDEPLDLILRGLVACDLVRLRRTATRLLHASSTDALWTPLLFHDFGLQLKDKDTNNRPAGTTAESDDLVTLAGFDGLAALALDTALQDELAANLHAEGRERDNERQRRLQQQRWGRRNQPNNSPFLGARTEELDALVEDEAVEVPPGHCSLPTASAIQLYKQKYVTHTLHAKLQREAMAGTPLKPFELLLTLPHHALMFLTPGPAIALLHVLCLWYTLRAMDGQLEFSLVNIFTQVVCPFLLAVPVITSALSLYVVFACYGACAPLGPGWAQHPVFIRWMEGLIGFRLSPAELFINVLSVFGSFTLFEMVALPAAIPPWDMHASLLTPAVVVAGGVLLAGPSLWVALNEAHPSANDTLVVNTSSVAGASSSIGLVTQWAAASNVPAWFQYQWEDLFPFIVLLVVTLIFLITCWFMHAHRVSWALIRVSSPEDNPAFSNIKDINMYRFWAMLAAFLSLCLVRVRLWRDTDPESYQWGYCSAEWFQRLRGDATPPNARDIQRAQPANDTSGLNGGVLEASASTNSGYAPLAFTDVYINHWQGINVSSLELPLEGTDARVKQSPSYAVVLSSPGEDALNTNADISCLLDGLQSRQVAGNTEATSGNCHGNDAETVLASSFDFPSPVPRDNGVPHPHAHHLDDVASTWTVRTSNSASNASAPVLAEGAPCLEMFEERDIMFRLWVAAGESCYKTHIQPLLDAVQPVSHQSWSAASAVACTVQEYLVVVMHQIQRPINASGILTVDWTLSWATWELLSQDALGCVHAVTHSGSQHALSAEVATPIQAAAWALMGMAQGLAAGVLQLTWHFTAYCFHTLLVDGLRVRLLWGWLSWAHHYYIVQGMWGCFAIASDRSVVLGHRWRGAKKFFRRFFFMNVVALSVFVLLTFACRFFLWLAIKDCSSLQTIPEYVLRWKTREWLAFVLTFPLMISIGHAAYTSATLPTATSLSRAVNGIFGAVAIAAVYLLADKANSTPDRYANTSFVQLGAPLLVVFVLIVALACAASIAVVHASVHKHTVHIHARRASARALRPPRPLVTITAIPFYYDSNEVELPVWYARKPQVVSALGQDEDRRGAV